MSGGVSYLATVEEWKEGEANVVGDGGDDAGAAAVAGEIHPAA